MDHFSRIARQADECIAGARELDCPLLLTHGVRWTEVVTQLAKMTQRANPYRDHEEQRSKVIGFEVKIVQTKSYSSGLSSA
jgi:hypothetical protein